jgi:hypothetical protein
MLEKYGLLTPLQYSHSKLNRPSDQFWLFQCDCGNTKISRFYDVKRGKISSCGCIFKKQLSDRNKANSKHGYFGTRHTIVGLELLIDVVILIAITIVYMEPRVL